MAKAAAKKAPQKDAKEIPASYAKKGEPDIQSAKDNPSKFSPTKNSVPGEEMLSTSDGVRKLFIDSIRDLYWAENHLVKALPKMANAASEKSLQQAILNHLEQTKGHVSRLEQIFGLLNSRPQVQKCDAMEGITKEGEGVVETTDAGTAARDLGVIMASQKAEHYEISAYTGLAKLANSLQLPEIADLLSQTLAEEQEADQILADIADNDISFSADKDQ